MIRRNTLILVIVFLVLLAAVLFWERSKLSAPPESTPTAELGYLFDLQGKKIQSIQLSGPEGKTLHLERDAEGNWTLVDSEAGPTDTAKVESAVAQLATMRILSTPELTVGLEGLGLDPALYILQMVLEDGQRITANIGKATPTGTGYYVLSSDRAVSVVNKYSLDSLLDMLDNPPVVLPTSTPEVSTGTPVETTGTLTPSTVEPSVTPVAPTIEPTATEMPSSPEPTGNPTTSPVVSTPTPTVSPSP